MNAIFLKEVPDSVLKGKLVKLNYANINNEEYIIEINISNKVKKCVNKENIKLKPSVISEVKSFSWLNNLYTKYTLIKFKNILSKIVKKNSFNGYSAVYSNELKKNEKIIEYIQNIFSTLSINKYQNVNSVEKNLDKYIEEYATKNNINKEKINILIIADDIYNLNFDLIGRLNEEYKEVNIYSGIKPNKGFLKRIEKINDEYGSCISVLNKQEKDFRKYNICIFIDKSRSEYTKYRFNKKTCFVDFTNKENDKFNEKYIRLENDLKKHRYDIAKIKQLYELYGRITVSNIVID